ncbi:uncharacterized protein [Battus philenor]|uniref:uncharacterized protein isoform X2 n=1 Tax=Battus philenor TaxID=42288 RepID=UPI0035CFCCC0
MKWLIFFGLCVVVVLSAPTPDDNDDDNDDSDQSGRRRFQTLSLKKNNNNLDDDDNNNDRRYSDDLGSLRVPPKDVYLNDAKNSQLDVLARELERLSAKYQGRGVLKVAYSPPKHRNVSC